MRTNGGDIEAEYVVIACGVWSPKIARMAGAAIPLTGALSETWQFFVLAAAALSLLALRRGIVLTLLAAGAAGAVIALSGGPVPS